MAPRTTACPKCRTQLDISGFKPGQRIRCGACQTVLRIPGEDPVAVAPVSVPITPQPQPQPAPQRQAAPGTRPAAAPGTRPAPAPQPGTRPMGAPVGSTQKISVSAPPPKPAAAPEPAKDDLIGYAVGGEFEITRKLGEGGYGAVYEALDRTLHRKVAVKLMLA